MARVEGAKHPSMKPEIKQAGEGSEEGFGEPPRKFLKIQT